MDYYSKLVPLLKGENESGDLTIIKETEDKCFLGLIDGLGHGKLANEAASLAYNYLNENFNPNLDKLIQELHFELKSSRGAVLALCCIDKRSGEMLFSGIGNISVRILNTDNKSIISRDGIVGYNIPTPVLQKIQLYRNDVLVIYSDGIKENIDLLDFQSLLSGSASEIGEQLYEKYAKHNDDASIITLKYSR